MHTDTEKPVYISSCRELRIDDYPLGRSKRGTAIYTVETKKDKERVSRVTIDPTTGRESKPKTTTYGKKVAILTSEDGRTYVATMSEYSAHIEIMQSNLKYSEESVSASSNPEQYDIIRNLIENAK